MKAALCRTRNIGMDCSKLGRIRSQKNKVLRERGNLSQEKTNCIWVRQLSKLWEFDVVHRNVLEGLCVLEELISQHYQTGKSLSSPVLINGLRGPKNPIMEAEVAYEVFVECRE